MQNIYMQKPQEKNRKGQGEKNHTGQKKEKLSEFTDVMILNIRRTSGSKSKLPKLISELIQASGHSQLQK